MATDAQSEANRANAQASTGPKTLEGKENSRQNALRHGLEARTVAALGEDDEDFRRYHVDLMAALSPRDTYEFALVKRLAQLSWRLDRLFRLEAAMLDGVANRIAAIRARYAPLGDKAPTFEKDKPADDLWNAELASVARYEAQLDHAFKRNMLLLERSQEMRRRVRKGAAAPNPDSVEEEDRHKIWNFRNEPNSAAPAGG